MITTCKMTKSRKFDEIRGRERTPIHSGHFMVSEFEADAQDDEEHVKIPVPEEQAVVSETIVRPEIQISDNITFARKRSSAIDSSLTKLFQCMSLAYR